MPYLSTGNRPPIVLLFSEMTATVRGRGWLRAITFGLLGIVLSVLTPSVTRGVSQDQVAIPPGITYPLEEYAWHEAPPGLPPGGKFAVISGNPLAAGPFVMRVRLPPGFVLPAHWRRNEEQVVVLVGAITVGTGSESRAATARTLTSGSYVLLPANELHFASTTNGAILQIFGIGPFEIEYPT